VIDDESEGDESKKILEQGWPSRRSEAGSLFQR